MKIKDLKEMLSNYSEDSEVQFTNHNGKEYSYLTPFFCINSAHIDKNEVTIIFTYSSDYDNLWFPPNGLNVKEFNSDIDTIAEEDFKNKMISPCCFIKTNISNLIVELYNKKEINKKDFIYINTKYKKASQLSNFLIEKCEKNTNKEMYDINKENITSFFFSIWITYIENIEDKFKNHKHYSKIRNLFLTLKKLKYKEIKSKLIYEKNKN